MQNFDRRTLLSILGVASITPLLSAMETTARTVAVAGPGENRFHYSTDFAVKTNPCKVTSQDSAGSMSIFESIIPSHSGPPLHVHHREDEWFYILAGDFAFEVDGKRTQLPSGGSLLAPRGLPHRWANTGQNEGRLVVVLQPGGFETFFDDLAKVLATNPTVDPKEIAGIFAKHDMELLGPMIYPSSSPVPPKS